MKPININERSKAIARMKTLIDNLNHYRDVYYNHDKSLVSDAEYDNLFDELAKLEISTGVVYPDSPTQSVGYTIQSNFKKVTHDHPMLSLDKTKEWPDVVKWARGKDIVGMLKCDGCFSANAKVIMADGSKKEIIKINPGDKVLSFDENTKQLTTSEVTKIFHNGEKSKNEWMAFYFYTNKSKAYKQKILCTKNHKIFTERGFVEAQYLKPEDTIYITGKKISKKQEEILLGILLGDGWLANRSKTINKNRLLEIHTSKTKNKNYNLLIEYLKETFLSFNPKITERTSGYSRIENNMIDINLHSISVPEYIANVENQLRSGLTFTKDICNKLTPLSLAMLYLDDGSKCSSQNDGYKTSNIKWRCAIGTNRHSLKEVEFFSQWLNSKGIINTINKEKEIKGEYGEGYRIVISAEGTLVFWDMIAKYIPKEFRKIKLGLDPRWQDIPEYKWWEDDSQIGLISVPIYKVQLEPNFYKRNKKRAYDLEIDNTHTYFVEGCAVHNCTISLTYDEDGYLQQAETRGDGAVGELITENVKAVSNIPQRIFTGGQKLTVDGEMIVKTAVFEKMNENLSGDDKFSHPRNYASGSIRQLDVNITKQRNLNFIAWKYVDGYDKGNSFYDNLESLENKGFEVVPFFRIPNTMVDEDRLESFKEDMYRLAESKKIPLDGLVFSFDDIEFGESLGMTGHHPLHSYAFKIRNEVVETILRDIEWSVGKSGIVAPTAIFDPVDLSGAVTSRATLHNLSYIWDLGIDIGSKIGVIRANEVIPRVEQNLGEIYHYDNYPRICPSCGQSLTMEKSVTQYREGKGNQITGKDVSPITLRCENPNCPAKNLARFVQFVSKAGMNIDGLSEATLEKFIDLGYIKTFEDIYLLDRYKDEIINLEGFGEKSWNKLWNSIQKSRDCKLENYLVALSIPLIGKTAAKTISKHFGGNYKEFVSACSFKFNFTQLEDFGDKMNESIYNWFKDNYRVVNLEGSQLNQLLNFQIESKVEVDEGNFCFGKTFVVTGKFGKPRSYYEELITSKGGKLAGSVSKKTDYLLTNDADSGSSKAVKAKSLGIPILSEEEFMTKVNG